MKRDIYKELMAWKAFAGRKPLLLQGARQTGKAELDFLCQFDGKICPLEVKAGINPKSKSLKSYDSQFKPPMLVRTNLLNLPLYAVFLLPSLFANTDAHNDPVSHK